MSVKVQGENLSDLQSRALRAVWEREESMGWVSRVEDVSNSISVSKRESRIALRALGRKGLVELVPAFDEDDGLLLGTGRITTPKGRGIAKELIAAEAMMEGAA